MTTNETNPYNHEAVMASLHQQLETMQQKPVTREVIHIDYQEAQRRVDAIAAAAIKGTVNH